MNELLDMAFKWVDCIVYDDLDSTAYMSNLLAQERPERAAMVCAYGSIWTDLEDHFYGRGRHAESDAA